MSYSEASAITGGDGSWAGELAKGWDILGVTNGGYALSLATKAMAGEADGRSLMSVSATYVNRSTAGPVEIDVQTLKKGRNTTALRATVGRDDTPLLDATGVFAARERWDRQGHPRRGPT